MILVRSSESWSRLVLTVTLGALLWAMLMPVASAQQTHTLNIRDGTVYVDGQPLAEDQLPDSLDLQGVRASYRFLGVQRPVVELKGRLFAVDDGLTPVTEEEVREERASVVLGGGATQPRAPQTPQTATTSASSGSEASPYLDAVQRSSRELYERLLHERQMEKSARDLARTIRLLPNGEERRTKIDTLRAMLEDIFEIKQENRRQEIQRLQQQIRELQKNLQKREQMRDRMIDRHLRQLIDSTRGR